MPNFICRTLVLLLIIFTFGCSRKPSEGPTPEKADDPDNTGVHTMIDYDDFLVRLEKISVGTRKDHVQAILGEPESKSDTIWSYDLRNKKGFPGIPPASGTTVFIGIDIVFENDRVKNISRSWMDVTGPQ